MTTPPTNPPEGMPELPIYAWASIKAPLVIHHQVKGLWLKVSAERVENYAEPLVLLDDALAYGRQCAAPKAPPMPEANELHAAIRGLGYTTHGQTAEIVDLVLALFRAQGITAKE